jgi:hypothetical protein
MASGKAVALLSTPHRVFACSPKKIISVDDACSWHWQEHGSADGAMANECSFAQLQNRTLVMNSRNYIGQQTHSVKRAIMWSHDEGTLPTLAISGSARSCASRCVFVDQGASWTEPYFNPDLPSPICEGDMSTPPQAAPACESLQ